MIRLRRLKLRGPAASYEVDFLKRDTNLAIVAGQISTGKTTILGFIDYCLGNDEHPTHPEIARNVRSAALELEADGVVWTIERPTFSSEQVAWVRAGSIADTNALSIRKTVDVPSDPDSLSAWLVQLVGMEGLRLKVTPGNPNSPTHFMSFRDLMWVCYLPNRRLDNEALLFEGNPFKTYKLQQVIEVLFDVADERLTDLMDQLTKLRQEHREMASEIRSLETFLRESEVPDRLTIETRRAEVSGRASALSDRIESTENEMREATKYADELRAEFAAIRKASLTAAAHLRDRQALVSRLLPLRGQYAEDERKLTFVGEARRLFDPLHVQTCPACLQHLPEAPAIADAHCTLCDQLMQDDPEAQFDVDLERKALRERMRDLDSYMAQVEDEVAEAARRRDELLQREQQLTADLDGRVAADLSPYVQAREGLVREREQLRSEVGWLDRSLSWQESLERRSNDLRTLEDRQAVVKEELEERRKDRPDKAEVVADLSERFAAMLRAWGFPKVDEGGSPRIDDEFVPWVRGRPYREIGSSGALTLIAVAWQLTLFERAIEEGAPHPGFLIIDSPQKNLSPDAVGDIEFLDPQIVDRMWAHMAEWARLHPPAQLIVVDNTPPESVRDHVIVRFSRDPEVPPYGLISDETG